MATKYSDAQRAEYWKNKALGTQSSPSVKRTYTRKAVAPTRAYATKTYASKPYTARSYPQKTAVRASAKSTSVTPHRRTPSVSKEHHDKHQSGTPGFTSAGGRIGSTIGNVLGHGAQILLKALTGFGDYTIDRDTNTMFSGGMEPAQIINSVNSGGVILRHREYLRDVLSSQDFESHLINLNPGLAASFPWMSGIANNYEKYQFRGLVLEFKSLSSDAVLSSAASSGLGSVMMATNYNVNDPPFANKQEMLNYEFANSRKPSESFYHPVECKASETPTDQLYVRSGPYAPDADPRLSDLGRFQLSTQGMQGDPAVIGELWITFEIELFAPKVPDISAIGDIFRIPVVTVTEPLGALDVAIRSNESTLLGTITDDGVSYVFPPSLSSGSYRVYYRGRAVDGLVTPIDTTSVPTVNNCLITSLYYQIGSLQQNRAYSVDFVVTLDRANASITFPITWTIPTTGTDAILIVQKYMVAELNPVNLSIDNKTEKERYARFLKMEEEEARTFSALNINEESSYEEEITVTKRKKTPTV